MENATEAEISDDLKAVKDALNIWGRWMNRGDGVNLGYGHSVGFNRESIPDKRAWERRIDTNMAINVMALYEDLSSPQRMAIDHFHLSAVWRPQRFSLEECYAQALAIIEKGLKRRGLI
jgi:hypothetical protein